MKSKWINLALLLTLTLPGLAFADTTTEVLPALLDGIPKQSFQILTPVGAGKKTILEAREQLQREAKKVDADAIMEVRCENGGAARDGLTFYRKDAYCRGQAIKYNGQEQPAPLL